MILNFIFTVIWSSILLSFKNVVVTILQTLTFLIGMERRGFRERQVVQETEA